MRFSAVTQSDPEGQSATQDGSALFAGGSAPDAQPGVSFQKDREILTGQGLFMK